MTVYRPLAYPSATEIELLNNLSVVIIAVYQLAIK